MVRLGLCCIFRDQPIKFRTTTATAIKRLPRGEGLKKLGDLCAANAAALMEAIQYCSANGIGCFRVNSHILPVKTHPHVGYDISELPRGKQIVSQYRKCGAFARTAGLRIVFHPDQFVVLNSPRPDVVEQSIAELEYQAEVAQWLGADVINVHAGGAYGDKQAALARLAENLARLSKEARKLITLENDDKVYTPADLLPICRGESVPLVYDVHHHRCNPDNLSVAQATKKAIATWNREPLFHLSSPIYGWSGPTPERHHDFIDLNDFPNFWRRRKITVEVEAKAKELAVEKLRKDLAHETLPACGRNRCIEQNRRE